MTTPYDYVNAKCFFSAVTNRTKTIRLYNYGQSYSSIYDYSIIRFMIMYFDYFDVWSGA